VNPMARISRRISTTAADSTKGLDYPTTGLRREPRSHQFKEERRDRARRWCGMREKRPVNLADRAPFLTTQLADTESASQFPSARRFSERVAALATSLRKNKKMMPSRCRSRGTSCLQTCRESFLALACNKAGRYVHDQLDIV